MNPILSVEMNERQLAALDRRLEKFANAMARPMEANRQASIALYGWTIRNFDRDAALQGGWVPLSPTTVRRKKLLGKEKMLVITGELRQSLNSFYSDENAGIGSPIPYARHHQFGVPKKHLPQREILPRRNVVLQIGLKVYGAYVARKAREANG